VRLWWVLVNGGQWAANEPILRLARSSGCLASLPLIITAADVQQATADKTVFLNRPEAICQYSLYAHQLGQNTQLTRTANWRDELGWWVVRVHSDQETEEQTVPAEYAEQFDAADPPCRHFRDVIIQEYSATQMREGTQQRCVVCAAFLLFQVDMVVALCVASVLASALWSVFPHL